VSTARKPEVADNRRMLVPACKPFDPTSLTISSRKNPFSPSFLSVFIRVFLWLKILNYQSQKFVKKFS
jgi:hypothetical protein